MGNCKACRLEVEEAAGRSPLGGGAEAHLAACRECRDFVRERAALRSLLGGLGRVSAPDDFDVRLRARMARGHDGGRGRFLFGVSFAPAFAAAAAVVFVCALATVLYTNRGRAGQEPVALRTQTPPAPAAGPAASPEAVASKQESSGGEVAGLSGGESKQPRVRRPAVAKALRARESAGRAVARAEGASASRTYSVGSSPVLELSIPVPTVGSADSMQVVVRDRHGSARVVPVRSVSFGSQELIASGRAGRRTAATSKEGVW